MIITVKNEAPFQVLTGAFTIGPSPTGYELQVGATPQSFTTLFSVGANTPRMVTNVANGSYYRLKNNVGDVKVNWSHTCIDNQGGGGGNAGELEPVSEFPVGAPAGTVVALASGNTVGVYQYDGTDWAPIGGGDMSDYYTKAQTDAAITAATEDLASEAYVDQAITAATQDLMTSAQTDAAITAATQDLATQADITAATSPIQEQVDDIERVTATALTELHDAIIELSGATGDYATEAYVNAAITSATQDFVTADALSGYTSEQDFQDFQDAISVKEEVIASALTELHDAVEDIDLTNYYTKSEVDSEITAATENMVTTGDIADMVTTGDIQNFVTSGDVATQISTATADMVESTSISTIWSGTQAQYDAISTKDPNTFYIITNS